MITDGSRLWKDPAARDMSAVTAGGGAAPTYAWRPGEMHLWSVSTDDSRDLPGALSTLDRCERARAGRFLFERDRIRFVLSHAFTRRVLSCYLGVSPADVAIRPGASGKPALDPETRLSFNTTRDDGLAVVAVSRGIAVGVDIERLRPIPDVMDIAEGLFAKPEIERLAALTPAFRSGAFLRLWTCKESVVKALGGGLSIPLDGFSMVTGGAGGRVWPVGQHGPLPFAVMQLELPGDYVGAVTAAGAQITVRYMDGARPGSDQADP